MVRAGRSQLETAHCLKLSAPGRSTASVSRCETEFVEGSEMSSTVAPWLPESGVSLRFIKETLFRGASIIAICGLIPVSAALGYLSVVPPSYMASTEILIDPRGLKAIQNDLTPRSENNESAIALLESQIRIVRSESVLRGVIGRLNLERDPE